MGWDARRAFATVMAALALATTLSACGDEPAATPAANDERTAVLPRGDGTTETFGDPTSTYVPKHGMS